MREKENCKKNLLNLNMLLYIWLCLLTVRKDNGIQFCGILHSESGSQTNVLRICF